MHGRQTKQTAKTPGYDRHSLFRPLLAAGVFALALVGGQAVATAPASAAPSTKAEVVYYDASGAEEFTDAVDAGAKVWNDNVDNVEFKPVPEGKDANVTVVATDGWPQTATSSLGNGEVEMGREAMNEGHDEIRVAAHELGHILGLPDVKPGPCTSLMSGASAGTDCSNAIPNADEKAEVESNFGENFAANVAASRPAIFNG